MYEARIFSVSGNGENGLGDERADGAMPLPQNFWVRIRPWKFIHYYPKYVFALNNDRLLVSNTILQNEIHNVSCYKSHNIYI